MSDDIKLQHIHNSLKSVLGQLSTETDPKSFVINHLEKFCTTDGFTFIYTLVILKQLYSPCQSNFSYPFKCLFRELESFMSDIESAKLIAQNIYFDQSLPSDLIQSILNIVSLPLGKNVSASDILKLHKLYVKEAETDQPPSIEFLRHPRVYEALINDSFGPNISVGHLRNEKLMLLSLNCSRLESVETGIDDSRVQATYNSLQALYTLTQKIISMSQIQDYFYSFIDSIQLPITSACLITWFDHQFQNTNFYEWTSFLVSPPLAFTLLDEIAHQHPLQHPQLIQVWIGLLHRPFQSKEIKPVVAIQYKQMFMDHVLLIARLGSTITILNAFIQNQSDLDQSLILYFITQLLKDIDGPYPNALIVCITQIVFAIQSPVIQAYQECLATLNDFFEFAIESSNISLDTKEMIQQAVHHLKAE